MPASDTAIDLVYTWVNGADPAWVASRNAVLQAFGRPIEESLTADRFTDNDELQFSLRSIERFAPWVNRIHIVTAGQTPHWLNTAHPKINLVDHRDIFADASVLPTFSCRPIEMNMWRIKGLAERFVYFNDDFFLGREARPSDFFDGDKPRVYTGSRLSGLQKDLLQVRDEAENSHRHGLVNTRLAVQAQTGTLVRYNIRHFPQPCTIALWRQVHEAYTSLLAATERQRFRHKEDVLPTYLLGLHALATEAGTQTRVNLLDAKPRLKERLLRLAGVRDGVMVDLSDHAYQGRLVRLAEAEPLFFCLNQVKDTPREAVLAMQRLLQAKFPAPSGYEKPGS
jgi:Stealth protein CR2, conserved region 2/Stealth protein CR1, conserved region 1